MGPFLQLLRLPLPLPPRNSAFINKEEVLFFSFLYYCINEQCVWHHKRRKILLLE